MIRNVLTDCRFTDGYSSKNADTHPETKYVNGEFVYTAKNISSGSTYIEIDPVINDYYFDCIISVAAGNHFYIGFEKFDENKTATTNSSCVYPVDVNSSSDTIMRHYYGTVNLKKDANNNDVKYIALRILNGWSGSSSTTTGTATVHQLSLREYPLSEDRDQLKFGKNGILYTDEFSEVTTASFYNTQIVTGKSFIEI